MNRFISILIVLLQYSLSVFGICLAENQVCGKRSSMIHQLDKALTEIKKNCGREPRLKMDWKSFESLIGGNDSYNVDACVKPIEFFVDFCAVNRVQAKNFLSSIEIFECQGVGIDKQALGLKNGSLKFLMDPTNDWRSNRKGPSVSDFVNQEMKNIFKINADNEEK